MRTSGWSSDLCSTDHPAASPTRRPSRRPAPNRQSRRHRRAATPDEPPVPHPAPPQEAAKEPACAPYQSASPQSRRTITGGAIPADGAPPLASISETAVKKPSPIVTFVVSASQRLVTPACRSEEHTSELQSLMRISYAVFCLKKKKKNHKLKKN